MKHLFLALGLSATTLAWGQQDHTDHETGNRFGVSVFDNAHQYQPVLRADIGVYDKLAAKFPKWYIETDKWTGSFKELNGKPFAVKGESLENKARNLMRDYLSSVGVKAEEWILSGTQTNPKGFQYLYFYQVIDHKRVAFSRMNFRFSADGQITRISMKQYGTPEAGVTPLIGISEAGKIAASDMHGATVLRNEIAGDLEWFPIPDNKGYQLHPAYRFEIEGKLQEAGSIPLNIFGYVDALTGELLYRDNESKDAIDLLVTGDVFTNGILNPSQRVGLPFITATGSSTTLLANDTGFLNLTAFPSSTMFAISLEGPYSKVQSATNSDMVPTFNYTVTTVGSTYRFETDTIVSGSRHVNAYYHVNTVHDFMKKYLTTFTGLDYPLITNVDVTGTCNAFFTAAGGGSINFFPAGGGCVSFAEVRDVVYHEYGHAIASKFYNSVLGRGMTNGALNEGQADVWAFCITNDPILAQGSRGTASSFIRRYDMDPKVYPANLVGQVHADGEIIAGAWWDYGQNVGSIEEVAKLFGATYYDTPDGPNGTEGQIYHDILLSALINDDDDMDLSNGTPHFREIADAFAKHGIYLLQDITFEHNEIAHQPSGRPIDINLIMSISNPYFFQDVYLVYRTSRATGALWTSLKMTDLGASNFTAQIPAQSEGTLVDYYFSVKDQLNYEGVFYPANFFPSSIAAETRSNIPFQFGVGLSKMYGENFENPVSADWTVGLSTDAATTGKWIQAKPLAAFNNGLQTQTGVDHTTENSTREGLCMVTGNSTSANAYAQSVKNGATTFLTPIFDMSGYTKPIVEYYRWFGNDRGRYPRTEIWRVQISSGSPIIFRDVENTNQPDYQWRRRIFNPLDIYTTLPKLQIRFIATETRPSGATNNGLVEAAVDDLVIYEGIEGISSIDEKAKSLAKIWPNPVLTSVNVELPQENYKELSIEFYDITGKLVSRIPTEKGVYAYEIDTKLLSPGQYLLVVKMDKTIQNHKLTIVR